MPCNDCKHFSLHSTVNGDKGLVFYGWCEEFQKEVNGYDMECSHIKCRLSKNEKELLKRIEVLELKYQQTKCFLIQLHERLDSMEKSFITQDWKR